MRRRGDLTFGFSLVFWREVGWLRRRPLLLAMTTFIPLAVMAVLALLFSAGLATRLPIGVIDLDRSDLSRSIVRAVDATPDVSVATAVSDLAEGRRLLLSGRIHGLLYLQNNLERDVQGGRQPEVVFFYNAQTMTAGNIVLRGINAALPTVSSGIRLSLRTARGVPAGEARASLQPVPVQLGALFNPTLDYTFFLLAALLPTVLQIVVTTSAAYSVGLDVETPHRLRVLRRLGDGLLPAVAGKLLPYTILFLVVLGLADAVLFGVLGLPLEGSRTLLVAGAVLFILACQFIGGLLALVLKPMASAVSMATLITAPALGFMGIGFPRFGMNLFAQWWGAFLPGTWFLTLRIDQTIRGTPLDLSTKPLIILGFFVLVPALLVLLRLEMLRRRAEGPALRTAEAAA
ncbi:Inner membrane transport permease YhhJ [Methylobacterium hispanicum]|uniref:Inner membrane transport permease YhhJ n=1 Tax=Methylobacterium hispanicum TaxID=270350 RepID=A0AAV4ZXF5_9HYPH|nr:ABC transporter permease [Methylobacterium hispanicum]GJD92702.1 Inner membrane transport permease YhhJ [Methylobacterium hispanicum]